MRHPHELMKLTHGDDAKGEAKIQIALLARDRPGTRLENGVVLTSHDAAELASECARAKQNKEDGGLNAWALGWGWPAILLLVSCLSGGSGRTLPATSISCTCSFASVNV